MGNEGFEAMMRFLVMEWSCENLLCYVELSQYENTWKEYAMTAMSPSSEIQYSPSSLSGIKMKMNREENRTANLTFDYIESSLTMRWRTLSISLRSTSATMRICRLTF